MFDRVTVRVEDLGASERFYRTVLDAIEVEPTEIGNEGIAWDDFVLVPAGPERPPTHGLHVGFVAPSREHVDEFWGAGIEADYEDAGKPGERPQYTPSYYGGFLRDPSGNSVEAVHHADVRRGGNVDHLWIRVRNLAASTSFYGAIARHTGLREGRRWEDGRQFRGAWATFSLVDDGAPLTENLHLAFPAPDRRTVEDFHGAARAAGYRSYRAPGAEGASYMAQILDPDGTIVESVCVGPSSCAESVTL